MGGEAGGSAKIDVRNLSWSILTVVDAKRMVGVADWIIGFCHAIYNIYGSVIMSILLQ